MIKKLKSMDRTLLELFTGILVFGILCQCAGLLLPISAQQYAIGLWAGIILAGASAFHMWKSLNKAFGCDEKTATRIVAGGYVVRYLATAVLLLFLFYTNVGYILAGFLGVMGLKAGAFLQPVTHKVYNRIFHETDPVAMPLTEEEVQNAVEE